MEIFSSEISRISKNLESFLPACLHTFHWTKFASENRYPSKFEPRCFVDRWPNPILILCSHFEPSTTKEWNSITIFDTKTAEKTEIREFLKSVDKIIHFSSRKCRIYCVEGRPFTTEILNFFLNTNNGRIQMLGQNLQLWWAPPETRDQIGTDPKTVIPKDLYLDRVFPSEAHYVNSVWPHNYPGSEIIWEDKIRYFPSRCYRYEYVCVWAMEAIGPYGSNKAMGHGSMALRPWI